MVFSVYKAATALLMVGSMGAEAASVASRVPVENDRALRAGIKRSTHKRALRIEPTFALDLPYIEGMWPGNILRMPAHIQQSPRDITGTPSSLRT